jgi:membrane-bound serine protease (ClpP class)
MDEKQSEKAASDAAAYIRSLATARGRNVSLAEEAVLKSRAFTEREAVQAAPPLVDFIAPDVDAVVAGLDGRVVRRFDGREEKLITAGAAVRRIEMTRRQRFLSAIAHPQVAYLLLSLGILGLTVELWNPGAVLPGVAGGLCLLLAFFAFQVLPISVAGLLLVIFGLSLLFAELLVPSFGVLGIGGALALFFGSVMLTDTIPGVQVSYQLIVPVVAALAAISLFLGRLGLKAQRQRASTGVDGLMAEVGRARTAIAPDTPGLVSVHGETWRAVSRHPIAAGQPVRIDEVHGLTLTVEAADPSANQRGGSWTSPPV